MVKYCAVAVCNNGTHNKPNLSYFRFPGNGKMRKKWEKFCKRADAKFKNLTDPRICSLHFRKQDMKKAPSGKNFVVKRALPTVFDPEKAATKSNPVNLRTERLNKRSLQVERSADKDEEIPPKKERLEVNNVSLIDTDLFQDCD